MEFLHIIVNSQNYLLSCEKIKEILKYPTIKPLAESSEYIEGIMNHKDRIIPIISIRKLLRFESFTQEQIKLLQKVKEQHISWMDDFENSVLNNKPFKKALDPHKCELGKWIDDKIKCMRCNHEGYIDIIKNSVIPFHNALHNDGRKFLKQIETKKSNIDIIKQHGKNTIIGLQTLENEIQRLSLSYEQLIIYDIDGIDVGFIVDSIDDLYQLDEKNFNLGSEPLSRSNEFIQFIDHYELNDELLFSMKFTNNITALVEQWREKEIA